MTESNSRRSEFDAEKAERGEMSPGTQKSRKGLALIISGSILAIASGLLPFSPIFLASINTAPGHNMWSEGDSQSGGSALWLMLLAGPLGAMGTFVGIVLAIIGIFIRYSQKQ